MSILSDITSLSDNQIENIEKMSLRWLVQAALDFGYEAYNIFLYSPDNVKDVAEDITREILDKLPGYNLPNRVFGTVDYKKARYIILPDQIIRQALFVDSKAEKSNSTATLQISQTSLEIRQFRAGNNYCVKGTLPEIYIHDNIQYISSTLFLHYYYEDITINNHDSHILKEIIACCVPNGLLQEKYNPNPDKSFWLAGRNAYNRGEDFRVRVSFSKLKEMANWRVQKIKIDNDNKTAVCVWEE